MPKPPKPVRLSASAKRVVTVAPRAVAAVVQGAYIKVDNFNLPRQRTRADNFNAKP